MLATLTLIVGAVLVVVGVALLSVPAALIVAGVSLAAAALLVDFDTFGRRRA
jgi:uncharacterized membrane-anchored protein YitT (DUF2179 family)